MWIWSSISFFVIGHNAISHSTRSAYWPSMRQNRDFNIHGLACFHPWRLVFSPCFLTWTPKSFFKRTFIFLPFTNWQPGRYHLNDVATPNSVLWMERKKMCCFHLPGLMLGFEHGDSTPLDGYFNHMEREARMESSKAMRSKTKWSRAEQAYGGREDIKWTGDGRKGRIQWKMDWSGTLMILGSLMLVWWRILGWEFTHAPTVGIARKRKEEPSFDRLIISNQEALRET